MSRLRVLSLFAGIGGFDLGLERAGGFESVAFVEINPYCRRVLAKHWPTVRQYEDVRTLTADTLRRDGIAVDVICGGFPCQPFSTASHGRRVARDFWPEFERIVDEIGPRYVIAENVEELPIRRAGHAFERRGYRIDIRRVGAHDGGADHQRDRWWACAYPDDEGELRSAIDAEMARLPALCAGLWPEAYARAIRVSDGLPNRMVRFRTLGNAVMPFIPEAFGRAINCNRTAISGQISDQAAQSGAR